MFVVMAQLHAELRLSQSSWFLAWPDAGNLLSYLLSLAVWTCKGGHKVSTAFSVTLLGVNILLFSCGAKSPILLSFRSVMTLRGQETCNSHIQQLCASADCVQGTSTDTYCTQSPFALTHFIQPLHGAMVVLYYTLVLDVPQDENVNTSFTHVQSAPSDPHPTGGLRAAAADLTLSCFVRNDV